MLVNLSNHPARGWSRTQRQAASAYGEVVDLPFPHVAPDLPTDEVARLARDYAARCAALLESSEGDGAVHVMGEMTFTCSVVAHLQGLGIRCVASTTVREDPASYSPPSVRGAGRGAAPSGKRAGEEGGAGGAGAREARGAHPPYRFVQFRAYPQVAHGSG